MLNISTTHSVSWPQPGGAQVAAVSAVDAVRPVQDSRRSGHSGSEPQTTDAGQRQKKGVTSSEADRAPLLPRTSRADADRAGRVAGRNDNQADNAALREAEQAEKKLAAEKAEAQARKQSLQAVLSDVWKASAAVVDRVLGRDEAPRHASPEGGVDGAAATPTSGPVALKKPAPEPLPWPVMPEDPAARAAAASAQPFESGLAQEVVAYDERGNSSLAPLETGVLLDRRI
jgi:hypothetical protein